jgi:protein-tyrosine phosphatase
MKASLLSSHRPPFTAHHLFTDIHCHLLPQIDDGPKDWEGSLAMARLAVANGIGTIVATPHQLGRYEKNSAEQILTLTAETQHRIAEASLPLTILPGADVRIQENLPELIQTGRALTVANQNVYLLMELPHEQVLPMGQLIYELQCQGITCILSHPERNQRLQKNPEILRPWVQQGCLIQVTAGSITGQFGREAERVSRLLLQKNLVHLVATDAHDATNRSPAWRPSFTKVYRYLGPRRAKKIFFDNPEAVVNGRPVDAPLPSTLPQTGFAAWFGSALATLRG